MVYVIDSPINDTVGLFLFALEIVLIRKLSTQKRNHLINVVPDFPTA